MVNAVPRAWRSFRNNGLAYTLRRAKFHFDTAMSRFQDRRFDARYGTDTAAIVEVPAMKDVTSPNLSHGIRYEPTRARPLLSVLNMLDLPSDAAMIDIGCGKGRALIVALEAGIARVDGVDYSPRLCDIARRNLARYRDITGKTFASTIDHCDAVEAIFTPEHNLVFMFNPFSELVLDKVLDNLDTSLNEHPRDLWLLYHHPSWRAAISARGRYECVLEKTVGGCEFVAYRARRQGAGSASASTRTS